MRIQLDLSPEQAKLLESAAQRLGVAPDRLAAAVLADLFAQPSADFERAAERVLRKNRELYERLAQ